MNERCDACSNVAFCKPVFSAYGRNDISRVELVALIKANQFPCCKKQDHPIVGLAKFVAKKLEGC